MYNKYSGKKDKIIDVLKSGFAYETQLSGKENPPLRSLEFVFLEEKPLEHGVMIKGLFDYKKTITFKQRVGKEIKPNEKYFIDVTEVKIIFFDYISEDQSFSNIVCFLDTPEDVIKDFVDKLTRYAIKEKIIDNNKSYIFERVQIHIDPEVEENLRNYVDDVVKLSSEKFGDDRVHGMSIRGTRLYESEEFRRALRGFVKAIGIRIFDKWYHVGANGKISTRFDMTEREFIEKIEKIIGYLVKTKAIQPFYIK